MDALASICIESAPKARRQCLEYGVELDSAQYKLEECSPFEKQWSALTDLATFLTCDDNWCVAAESGDCLL